MNMGSIVRRVGWAGVVMAILLAAPHGRTMQAAQAPSPAAGTWTGRISLPQGPLEVTVVLAQEDSTRRWSGSIDIPAQGANGLALAGISASGRSVSFAIADVPGNPAFTGTLTTDGESLTGTFRQAGGTFPFELRRGGRVRPQEPKPPFPYREELVTYRNQDANIGLAGTLTLPQGDGRFPAVVLISGSGPQDRDSTLFGHKPFLLLADTLTRRGIAVLRVDDRGVGGSDRGSIEPTSADLAGDVRAGLQFLESRADINPDRIGLIGMSEGANIAAMVAADTPRVRFIVMLAGNGVRGDELLTQQAGAIMRAQGVPAEVIEWDLALRRSVYALVNAETDGTPNESARQALIDRVPPIPGAPDATNARNAARLLLQSSTGRWFRYFLAHDPRPTLTRVSCPVLALGGERDLQVPATENLAAIRSALEASGSTDVTVRELPELNHLFQTSQTGAPPEYATIEETMAPAALSLIADWVAERAR